MLRMGHSMLPLLAYHATQRRSRSLLLLTRHTGSFLLPSRRSHSSLLSRHSTLLWRRGNMLRGGRGMLTLAAPQTTQRQTCRTLLPQRTLGGKIPPFL